MCSKFIFLAAILCAVQASVINVNVYDDSLAKAEELFARRCNYQDCNESCQRRGHSGGVCVNNRCRCKDVKSLAETPSNEELSLLGDCNNRGCDQSCRRIGFTGGVCVNGRCKCDINRQHEESPLDEELALLGDCNNRGCDQSCRRIGFTGGVCVNGRCKCDINRQHGDGASEDAGFSPLRRCFYRECQVNCRRAGFPTGTCVAGRCECSRRSFEQENMMSEAVFTDVEPADTSRFRMCFPTICNGICRIKQYDHGSCVNGSCQCAKNEEATSTTPAPAPIEASPETSLPDQSAPFQYNVDEANLVLYEENENEGLDKLKYHLD